MGVRNVLIWTCDWCLMFVEETVGDSLPQYWQREGSFTFCGDNCGTLHTDAAKGGDQAREEYIAAEQARFIEGLEK